MKRLLASLVFLAAFGLNVFLAFPSLSSYRDSGDFGAAVSRLGVAHPPGYPLYILSGKVFQLILPWANPIYRINIFAALCIALAAVFIFLILSRLTGIFGSLIGAFVFVFLPSVLSQAGLSEIYALNAALTAGLLYLLTTLPSIPIEQRWRRWAFLSFALGLGCGNHQTLLALVPVGFLVLFREWKINRLRQSLLSLMIFSFIAGLSISFMPIFRAIAGASYMWGEPASLNGFFDLVTRADYGAGTLSTRHSAASADQAILFWFKSWMGQWGISGVLLWLAGSLWAFRQAQRQSWGGIVLTLWIFSGPIFGLLARLGPGDLSQAIMEPALIMPMIPAAIMVGAFVGETWRQRGLSRSIIIAALLLHGFFYGSPAIFQHRQRENYLADDYGKNLLRTLPPQSVLLMISDGAVFSAIGRQNVFGERADVRLLVDAPLPWRWRQYRRRFPELFADGQIDGGMALARNHFEREKIFTEGLQPGLVDNLCPQGMAASLAWPTRGDGCFGVMEASDFLWQFYMRRIPQTEVLAVDYYSRDLAKTAASNAYNAGLLLRQAGREEAAQRSFARALFWSPERWMRWTDLY